jgi:hypothetical protein
MGGGGGVEGGRYSGTVYTSVGSEDKKSAVPEK